MKQHAFVFVDNDSFECVKCGKFADFDTAIVIESECDESEVYPEADEPAPDPDPRTTQDVWAAYR
jgi:hypothetical protein